MNRMSAGLGIGLALALAVTSLSAQDGAPTVADGRPLVSIKDLMEKTITPASNTLWGAYDPPADEAAWLALEEAAVTMLVASQAVAIGGTGPMDNDWAEDPRWKAFDQVMIGASYDALDAVRARDHEALVEAGNVLYPPCEGCHLQFNPGVVDAE